MTRYIRPIIIAIAAILGAVPGAGAFNASDWPDRSPLASGLWVRVTTSDEGIYQLSYDRLREMGFSDPSRVRVWGVDHYELSRNTFSKDLAAGMIPVPSMHTSDGRLLFYGQGEARLSVNTTGLSSQGFSYARNYYERSSSYLLSDAAEAPALAEAEWIAPQTRTPLTSHLHMELCEEELSRAVEGGVLAQGRRYAGGDQIPFTFRVRNWEAGAVDSLALFSYVVDVSSTSSTQMFTVLPDEVRRVKAQNLSATNVEFPVIFSECRGSLWFAPRFGQTYDDDMLTINVKVPARYFYMVAADRAMIAYPRANRFDDTDPSLVMVLGERNKSYGQEIRFDGAASDMRLWLVDDLRRAVSLEPKVTDGDSPSVSFTLPRTCARAVAFEPGRKFPEPKVAGAVPSSNLAGTPVPDLLIVTTDALLPQARELAELHRTHQGLDVVVATQKQISAEFCSGGFHAMGTRLAAKMFYDRDPAKFKYLLLYGPSFSDQRGVENTLDFETLACYETDNEKYCMNSVKCYVSDNYFGMLADGYVHDKMASQPTQVAVGRISARMPSQASSYNEKARRWFLNPPTPEVYSSAVLVSGGLNKNSHVEHCLEVQNSMSEIKPDFTFTQVPVRVYPASADGSYSTHHNVMMEALRRGAGYFSYSGHGAINFIDNPSLLDTRSAITEEYEYAPFTVLSSCAQFGFDGLGTSLLETMVLFPRGGSIAGVAAAREVYLNYNQLTCLSVAEAYASAGPGSTVGSVYLDARRRVLSKVSGTNVPGYEPDELVNNMSYNLAGDPAMPLSVPTRMIRLNAEVAFTPLEESQVVGFICLPDGTPDNSFEGNLHITVYDGAHTVTTRADGEADFVPLDFEMENDVLGTATAKVTGGKFSLGMVLPEPFYAAPSYRMVLSASRNDTSEDGAIGTAYVPVAALPSGDPGEDEAPRIMSIYADSPSFDSGDEVGSVFTLYAEIDAGSSGIKYSTAGIAPRTGLMIDGMQSFTGIEGHISRRDDGSYLLAMPVTDVADGYHNLDLTVVNNAGRMARASLDVMAMTRGLAGEVKVDREAVRDRAMISLDGTDASVTRLFITDASGATVYTAESPALPLDWNLSSSEGTALPDGEYRVRMLLRSGSDFGEAKPARLVILR